MENSDSPPVTLFLFNRPDYLNVQLPAIENLRPATIYVFIDGPDSKKATVQAQKDILLRLNAEKAKGLNIQINHRPRNLGTRDNIKSGLDEVFRREPFSIVLEDDCIPSPLFGDYVNSVRHQVEANSTLEVGTISGNYFGKPRSRVHLSKFPRTWGWATWSHTWQTFEPSVSIGKNSLEAALSWAMDSRWPGNFRKLHWRKRYLQSLSDRTMWDAQWTVHNWARRQYAVSPGRNLVTNIGNDERAVHSSADNFLTNWPVTNDSGMSLELPSHFKKTGDRLEHHVLRKIAYKGLLNWQAERFRR